MRSYDIELKVSSYGNPSVELEYKANLKYSDDATISDMKRFIDSYKKIIAAALKASKKGNFMCLTVSRSSYDNWGDSSKELKQKDFDFWKFEGYNDNEEGIHLNPDQRYTAEHHDLWLTKNFFESFDTI